MELGKLKLSEMEPGKLPEGLWLKGKEEGSCMLWLPIELGRKWLWSPLGKEPEISEGKPEWSKLMELGRLLGSELGTLSEPELLCGGNPLPLGCRELGK
jgi:hypothetical protein